MWGGGRSHLKPRKANAATIVLARIVMAVPKEALSPEKCYAYYSYLIFLRKPLPFICLESFIILENCQM